MESNRKAVAAKLIIDEKEVCTEISFLDTIYKHLNRNNYTLKCILFNNEIIDVFDRNEKIYVAAVDIGTTSIVCYLLDAETGEEAGVASTLNPQSQYGADVIQRLNHAVENGVEDLTKVVREAINELVIEAAIRVGFPGNRYINGISRKYLYVPFIYGNNTLFSCEISV